MASLVEKANEFLVTYSLKQREEKEYVTKVTKLSSEVILHEDALKWLNGKRKEMLTTVITELNTICSLGLKIVFGEDYEFDTEISETTRPQCTFYVVKNGEKYEPKFELGGGVSDMISICIRIALWSLKRTAPIIILDEPIKALKPLERQEAAISLLKQLITSLGLQFIVVTHEEALLDNTSGLIHKIS